LVNLPIEKKNNNNATAEILEADDNNNEHDNSNNNYIDDDDEMKNEVDREDNSDPDSQNDDDKGYNDDENKDRDEGDYYYFNEGERKENLSGVKNFNVNNEILAALLKANTPLPSDDNELLYKKEDVITSRTTKGNFARRIHAFCKTYRLTAIAEHDMLIIINDSFPHANLPIKKSEDKDDNDNFKSTVSKYIVGQSCLLNFDACKNGCTVYVGDNSDKIVCETCKSPRFTNCRFSGCKSKTYNDCLHSLQLRTPIQIIQYKPILPLVIELIKTKGFLEALNKCRYIHNDRDPNVRVYGDVLSGRTPKESLEDMQARSIDFNDKYLKNSIPVNIIISQFYDGAHIFKHQSSNFWPIMISILNLPPTFRTVVGAGIFLVALFIGNMGSPAEEFLIEKCFVAELNSLYFGQEIIINGVSHFIQVRLVLHLFDTKAFEHMMKVQGSNSYSICPVCGLTSGSKRKQVGSVIWENHRRLLPLNHYLRGCGQSGTCCPLGYCTNQPNAFQPLITGKPITARTLKTHLNHISNANLQRMQPCDSTVSFQEIINLWQQTDKEIMWYNTDFPASDFAPNIYYHHFDYRAFKPYQRIQNDVYRVHSDSATTKNPIQGIKGKTAFLYLRNFDIATQVNWENFHVLLNGAKRTLRWLKRRIGSSIRDQTYCTSVESHPSTSILSKSSDKIVASEWGISISVQDQIDCWLECVNVPSGYSSDLSVHNVFSHTGDLTGKPAIDCITVLMDFMLLCFPTIYPKPYRNYLRLMSSIYTKLLAPEFTDAEISDLYNRVNEFVNLHNAMLPASLSFITFHQLIDLPNYIKLFGSLRNWWTFAGERSLSVLKAGMPKGGQSYHITVLNRYLSYEAVAMQKYYDFTLESLAETPSTLLFLSDRFYNFDTETMCFNEKKCKLFKRMLNIGTINSFEHNQICLEVVYEVIKCCVNEEDALKRSFVYRLYKCYHSNNASSSSFLDFLKKIKNESHIEDVNNIIMNGDLIKADSLINLNGLSFYQSAYIYGVKITARGFEHRETEEAQRRSKYYGSDMKNIPKNDSNNLQNHWHFKNQYSSWCKYRAKSNKKLFDSDKTLSWKNYYGQLNYYLSISLHDDVVPKLAFGSVTSRRSVPFKTDNYTEKVDMDNFISYNADHLYIPLTDLYSTAIAIVGFEKTTNQQAQPILLKQRNSLHSNNNKYLSRNKENANFLLLIDIHRERLKIGFDSIHNFDLDSEIA